MDIMTVLNRIERKMSTNIFTAAHMGDRVIHRFSTVRSKIKMFVHIF